MREGQQLPPRRKLLQQWAAVHRSADAGIVAATWFGGQWHDVLLHLQSAERGVVLGLLADRRPASSRRQPARS